MPQYYTEETVVKDKFLFISYSHEEKSQVRQVAEWLINEGVRLWYDADLGNGDIWIEKAQRMLNHENCIGTIFFNSLNSYISDPVAQERAICLRKKESWAKEGKTFHIFVVNMGKPSTMRLIKQVMDSLPDHDGVIRSALTTERLGVIVKLFDDTRIYSFMDPDAPEAFRPAFLENLIQKAPGVVNKTELALEEMEKLSKNSGIFFKLGKWKLGGESTALEWQFVCYRENEGIFLLKQVLDDRPGFGLDRWLNEEFKAAAFTPEERSYLLGEIRLLCEQESGQLSAKLLETGRAWWLSDTRGALQKVVREDGTIYHKGSVNTQIKRGVRPVIVVDMNTAKDLMS